MTPIQFENQAAQGDMLLTYIGELPATAVPAKAENGFFILAHSETGHHHVTKERPEVEFFNDSADAMTSYLRVLSIDTLIEHQRSFDTHKTLNPKRPGVIKIRRQREAAPEGWRKAQD